MSPLLDSLRRLLGEAAQEDRRAEAQRTIRGLPGKAQKFFRGLPGSAAKPAAELWSEHRRLVIAGAAGLACLIGLIAYLILKRPGDVFDPDAAFILGSERQTEGLVDWPTYGYNLERTRHLPSREVKPPFKRVWGKNTGGLLEYSPVVYKNKVYGINNEGVAFSFNAVNGHTRWKKRIAKLNASAPTVYRGRLYIVSLDPPQVLSLDADSGKLRWKRDLPGRSESSPLVVDRRVMFGTENGELWALDTKGRLLWKRDLAGEVKAAPAYQDGILYVGDYGGEMWAIRAEDGSTKWQASDQGVGFGRSGRFYATPAVAFGRVYAGNVDGRMYSYVAESGDLAWSQSTGNYVYAAPAAADTPKSDPTIYFGSYDGDFYALDARTGDERWAIAGGGAISGAASVIGDVVYFANITKTRTVGVDVRNGKRVYGLDTGAFNPVISDGVRLYVTGYSGIEAFEPIAPEDVKKGKGKKSKRRGKRKRR